MGVQFGTCTIHATLANNKTINVVQESKNPLLPSIIGITKLSDDGTSNKVQTPYLGDSGYKTVWEPTGQTGWTVSIQGTLRSIEGASSDVDEIIIWQLVDTGTILQVKSNQYTRHGHDKTSISYTRLPTGSLWYVDQIVISSIKGVIDMVQFQLTLVRCWGV